jgi:hypothetical protein
VERQRLDPAERALDAAARHSQLRGELAQRRLRGSAAERGHCPDRIWLSCKSAVTVENGDRRELAGRRSRDAVEVRRLGIEQPVEVAPNGS